MKKHMLALGLGILLGVVCTSCQPTVQDGSSSDSAISAAALNISSSVSAESMGQPSAQDPVSSRESTIQEELKMEDIVGQYARMYQIDKDFIEESNQDLNMPNVQRGNIESKYTKKWEETMEYYYDVLYEALDDEGKAYLQASQEAWQLTVEADWEVNSQIEVLHHIILNVFDHPRYNAYRSRAIALYEKCCIMAERGEYAPLE